jgi:hypothetical protein
MQTSVAHATLFPQQPASTDFLLVRSKGAEEQVLVRRVDGAFVVGQVEPQVEVFAPSAEHIVRSYFTRWIEHYMAFHFAGRLIRKEDMRLSYGVAMEMFSYAPESLVQRTLRQVAEPSPGQQALAKRAWYPLGTREFPSKEPHEFRRELEDKRRDLIARELRPEEACNWESMQVRARSRARRQKLTRAKSWDWRACARPG